MLCYSAEAFNKLLREDDYAAEQFIILLSTTSSPMDVFVSRPHSFLTTCIFSSFFICVGGKVAEVPRGPSSRGWYWWLAVVTGNAVGFLLLLKTYCLPLNMLCPKKGLMSFTLFFFKLLSSWYMQNLLMLLHAENCGLQVWMHTEWMDMLPLVIVDWEFRLVGEGNTVSHCCLI